MNEKCPLCGQNAPITSQAALLMLLVNCSTCGRYQIRRDIAEDLNDRPNPEQHILSGITRDASDHNRLITITADNLSEILQSPSIPAHPLQAMDRILLYLARAGETAADPVSLGSENYHVAFARNEDEFIYFIENLENLLYIERRRLPSDYRLTPEGWRRVIELRQTHPNTDQCFVALWVSDELNDAWNEGFKPALVETGFRPLRVDLEEHNEMIDDYIIAQIRRSGLLVADFTGHRAGVYFEAGFAMGLGIPVIWTCRDTDLSKSHFDTRQYNHVVWTDPAELRGKLQDRVAATIPGRAIRIA